jgi:hypothetical protein
MTDDSRIEALVRAYLAPDADIPHPGAELRALGPAVVPALARAYATTGRWQGRAALVVAAMFHARHSDAAVALGVQALGDRSTVVRYRGCGLLAYAGRDDALPALHALARHPDERTRADAAAAVVAIETRNHHRFVDRAGVGGITWNVNDEDGESPNPSAWRNAATIARRAWRIFRRGA